MQRYQRNLLSDDKNFAIEYVERPYTQDTMYCGHCHVHYEIYVQMSGRRCYFLKNSVYEIETGDVVFIAPGLVHKTSNIDKNPHSRLLIEFDERYLEHLSAFVGDADFHQKLSRILTDGYYIYRNETYKENILKRCRLLVENDSSGDMFEKMKCRLSVGSLLLDIMGETFDSGNASEISSRYKISEILDYINKHYSQNISLKETSEKFYLSYYYLSRLFKEVTGFTFVAYVNIIRVNKAKTLIDDTNERLDTISETVGFGSQKQFVRVFKSLYGISPSKYRSLVKRRKQT